MVLLTRALLVIFEILFVLYASFLFMLKHFCLLFCCRLKDDDMIYSVAFIGAPSIIVERLANGSELSNALQLTQSLVDIGFEANQSGEQQEEIAKKNNMKIQYDREKNIAVNFYSRTFLGGAPTLMCHFVFPFYCPSVFPSVHHQQMQPSGTSKYRHFWYGYVKPGPLENFCVLDTLNFSPVTRSERSKNRPK